MLARCLLSGDRTEEVRIFYSYSRQDSDFRSLIDDVLGRFKWDVDVRSWYDGEIPAGTEWEDDICRHIDAADIILLFVTRGFASSSYCQNVELPRALERHERGEATVIPVLVEPIDDMNPAMSSLQSLPRNGQPVNAWADRDEAIRSIIQGIVDIIAAAALDPEGRCRWQLRLRGEQEELDDEHELRIVQEMRSHAQDDTLRPLALGPGSVMFLVDSTRAGLTSFKSWHREQAESKVAGLSVLEIIELFGAGVQAQASEVDGEQAEIEQKTDLLLFPSERYAPVVPKGIVFREEGPLGLDFTIDTGNTKLEGEALAAETRQLIDYFLTSVAVPEDEQWVNLSPDESNRMLGKHLAGTDMGRRLLESDLRLKRLSASLMHPDCDTGRAFWERVFSQTRDDQGPFPREFATFQRVWLVPKKAVVYTTDAEDGRRMAFVVDQHIEVLCEDDYLSAYSTDGPGAAPNSNDLCTPIFREIILPVIEKEVNEGRSFANFRQVYSCLILAYWLKGGYRDHPSWAPYIDSGERLLAPSIRSIGPADLKGLLDISDDREEQGGGAETVMPATPSTDTPPPGTGPVEQLDEMLDEAVRLRRAGRLEESLQALHELVETCRGELGSWTNKAQSAMSQLGRTLRALGRHDEAREMHQEVLRIRRFVLGDNHPDTIKSMGILADTLEGMGEASAAKDLRAEITDRKSRTSEAFSIRENREFYEQYMRVFRNGVFRLTRNEYRHDRETSTRVSRTYFSGALDLRSIPLTVVHGPRPPGANGRGTDTQSKPLAR